MTSQAIIELVPETASAGIVAAGTSGRIGATGTRRKAGTEATARQRLAGWRARHWRRLVLGWFVLSLAVVAVAAEPQADFPKAQAGTVPAVRTVLRVAGGVTAAGVPLVLIVLP